MKQETNKAQLHADNGNVTGGPRGCAKMAVGGNMDPCISCTTFNILAPIYKRLDKGDQNHRESQHRLCWLSRNQSILDMLLLERSSIICLQEVWLGNEELVEMYENGLGEAGYMTFKLARTNNRGDGLLTAVHQDYFTVLNYQELLFNDFGDRVAQLLHVEPFSPARQSRNRKIQQEILIVNTHLLFPHDYSYCLIRLRQVYKILQYVKSYQEEKKLGSIPIILCGDWNGSKRGNVYKFLRSQGFISSYDAAHDYSDIDAHKVDNCQSSKFNLRYMCRNLWSGCLILICQWVSHLNHRGNICGVDFIWLQNPHQHRKPLKTSWNEALFAMIKYLLRRASLPEYDAFTFLKADSPGDYITYPGFCQALFELGLSGTPHGLSFEEIEHLWIQADMDEDGILDYIDFQRIWDPKWAEEEGETQVVIRRQEQGIGGEAAIGFDVKKAALFPPEAEKGMWPENYSLSDHAPLTAIFAPRRMSFTQSFR